MKNIQFSGLNRSATALIWILFVNNYSESNTIYILDTSIDLTLTKQLCILYTIMPLSFLFLTMDSLPFIDMTEYKAAPNSGVLKEKYRKDGGGDEGGEYLFLQNAFLLLYKGINNGRIDAQPPVCNPPPPPEET